MYKIDLNYKTYFIIIFDINNIEYYNGSQHKYNIVEINNVDIKEVYTEDEKYRIMSSLHNNVLGRRGRVPL